MAGFWTRPAAPSGFSIAGGQASLGEIFSAAHENMLLVDNTFASVAAHERAYDELIGTVFDATGARLDNPYRGGMPNPAEIGRLNAEREAGNETDLLRTRKQMLAESVQALARQHPGRREELLKGLDTEARAWAIAREAGNDFEEKYSSRGGFAGFMASLAGGMTGALRDPVQLYTLVAGGGPGAARTIGGRIARTAMTEAAVNGLVEAGLQPVVQDWRKTVGLPHGWDEAARNVGFAAALGGVFGAGGRSIAELVNAKFPGVSEIPEDAPIRRAADDDLAAGEAIAPLRDGLDAEARGAVDTLEAERAFAAAGDMTQAMRRAEAPQELEPVPVEAPRDLPELERRVSFEGEGEFFVAMMANRPWQETGNLYRIVPIADVYGTDAMPATVLKGKPQALREYLDLFTPENMRRDVVDRPNPPEFAAVLDGRVTTVGTRSELENYFNDEIKRDWVLQVSGENDPNAIAWRQIADAVAHRREGDPDPAIVRRAAAGLNQPRPIGPPDGIDDLAAPDVALAADDAIAGLIEEAQVTVPAERIEADAGTIRAATREIQMFDPAELKVDAARFQFKEGGDAEGVTERLRGVKTWKPEFAGIVIVWQARNGDSFVADGHQRTGLARRIAEQSGEDISIPGVVFREADGYSAADVRTIAALKNIAEGSGSAVDAAKVLRSGESDLVADLPPNSALVRDAAGLARLSDDAFTMVVNELVKPSVAAVVGRLVADADLHAQMLDALKREGARGISEAQSMVRDMLQVATVTERQDSLFGAEETSRMLLKERAKVRAAALNRLKKDRHVFSTLTREADLASEEGNVIQKDANARRAQADAQLIEIIEKLANRAGPIAEAFNAAASEVAGGAGAPAAARSFVDAVRAEIERTGGNIGGIGGAGPQRTQAAEVAPDSISEPAPDTLLSGVEVPVSVRADDNGELFADTATLGEVVEDADRLTDFADLLRSCKT